MIHFFIQKPTKKKQRNLTEFLYILKIIKLQLFKK